jgi:CRISPR/Cas system-associated endonuclease Cas1
MDFEFVISILSVVQIRHGPNSGRRCELRAACCLLDLTIMQAVLTDRLSRQVYRLEKEKRRMLDSLGALKEERDSLRSSNDVLTARIHEAKALAHYYRAESGASPHPDRKGRRRRALPPIHRALLTPSVNRQRH